MQIKKLKIKNKDKNERGGKIDIKGRQNEGNTCRICIIRILSKETKIIEQSKHLKI